MRKSSLPLKTKRYTDQNSEVTFLNNLSIGKSHYYNQTYKTYSYKIIM